MKTIVLFAIFISLSQLQASAQELNQIKNIYGFEASDIEGKTTSLKKFKGKVVLIVNVASKCGLTKQYEGLETLYKKYKDKGLVILGFPCNQFLGQEPGTEAEIAQFCSVNYGVSFPMFSKISVNGDETHPLYKYLKSILPGKDGNAEIEWNFAKFLIDREGVPVLRFHPKIKPVELEAEIEKLLADK
jgi:glutathione peroxidase